jgi:transcriptional regulator with XRE-family HTH domain
MPHSDTFAARLRDMRSERGLSKSGLARAVGVSTTCVWNWEEGNTNPRPAALGRIATALATTEAYLERGVSPKELREAAEDRGSASSSVRDGVGAVVLRAREEIAAAAGLTVNQVKVVLEYGA